MGKGEGGRLSAYRRKRDFSRTAEPRGADADGEGGRFVVQRHRARRRHYDLRLELNGVLLSWAVPKGPSLDPKARRLAVQVEDHPLEYLDFEGVIPSGEYGGGDVIVWDRGRWEPVDAEPEDALREGTLHFDLYGQKIAGRFVLVRTRGEQQKQWLLLHKSDDHAASGWDAEKHPQSIKSGHTNEEVAAAPPAVWHGELPAEQAEVVTSAGEWPQPSKTELKALKSLGDNGSWEIAGRIVKLTNLNKVLAPGPVTKRDLIEYYATVAPTMLKYLAGRPVNTHRFPQGIGERGIWQKHLPAHAPSWLRRWERPEDGRIYLVPDEVAALVWLANFGALELHPWTSRVPDIDHPTWVLFDIDPGERSSFADVLTLARLHRAALEHLGLRGRPKVSGQRGIQVWVPIEPRYDFTETRAWAEKVSQAVGGTKPELISWKWNVTEREGLARLDYTQNARHKTLVAPYSVRPRAHAPVSVPLEWDELDDPKLRPDRWTIRDVPRRLAKLGDPFDALLDDPQRLPEL